MSESLEKLTSEFLVYAEHGKVCEVNCHNSSLTEYL
ncbi:hypothetical protein BF9343_0123 [Bacteroides fragilis NCTC 9343]|uniref:Uncharacterized protein n=1 Tax=Bacteroides fragilis (strain ATCC 25285 / DSM 2151 / CCUG 4856 / JCM 11019 / LMG 10263 / NCTC 9343 / Onslow / VPI 2553 / EN-2) TaxID=272559 RepID=Q5LIX4_BACFN|nr:hypothetical protein BF9343_0123 [Bacteroides fragilis NCTC 9343]